MAPSARLTAFSDDGKSDHSAVHISNASTSNGIEYTKDGTTHSVDVASIVAAHQKDGAATVLFLDESKLFSITDDELGGFVHRFQPTLKPKNIDGHIIVSVLSGKCQAEPFYQGVISPLLNHFNWTKHYTVHKTTSSTSVIELAQNVLLPSASLSKQQHVLLLSGDGGIVDIVNELLSADTLPADYEPPVISLIPMGTGNALAHSTKIFDRTNGLSSWLRGQPKDLPLIRAAFSHNKEGAKLLYDEGRKQEDLPKRSSSDSYFWGAVVFSWGFHAQIVADSDTPEYRKHGVKRFAMAAQEALFPADGSGPHKYRGILTAQTKEDGHSIRWAKVGNEDHCYVLGTLVSHLEETFTISPKSTPFNGIMRLVHIGHNSGDEIMRIMGLAYQQGKHIGDKHVDYEEVDGFLVRFDEGEDKWRRVCIDGKIILVERGGSVEVQRESRVVVQLMALSTT